MTCSYTKQVAYLIHDLIVYLSVLSKFIIDTDAQAFIFSAI